MCFNKLKRKTVAVAMSGGVDSSVAAALLLQKGYRVIGVHMEIDPYAHIETPAVKNITERLGIPFTRLSLVSAFKKEVIDYFAKEYLCGHTPNPCIVCNERIKFGLLLHRMREIGADFLATGHYAKITKGQHRYLLLKAEDTSRDQSYFLYRLNQEQLSSVLFPLGDIKKDKVRAIAQDMGLTGALKPESREICFIPHSDYKAFLTEQVGPHILKTGDIIDTKGNIIGRHSGIYGFTIGQRRGLKIPSTAPYYVRAFDVKYNRVIVGRREDLYTKGLIAKDVNWIAISRLDGELKVKTKIRYKHKEADSVITREDDNRVRVIFKEPQKAVTPGQAAVFYQGPKVIGGGWIESGLEN
ncbi:MAG TPA: tRNA 2-thiouridine(34) synthase MnmA [Syntrophaceae bacterium]|nr:tRNA 2-thiouridine(34) synthase MnmA [Syntrophaceae bacterium]